MFTSFQPPLKSKYKIFPALYKIPLCLSCLQPLPPRHNHYSDFYHRQLILSVLELSVSEIMQRLWTFLCIQLFTPLHLSMRFIPGIFFFFFLVPVFGRCYLFACSLHLNGSIQFIQQIILLLCPNPLYEYTSMYISILLLIGIQLFSSVGLL